MLYYKAGSPRREGDNPAMHVDALTLDAVADEFGQTLIGARIDTVIQPTPQAVALQTYSHTDHNRWLIASAHPQLARIHILERKPRKLVLDPPSFVMLLRKYLEGARIKEVRHPRWERLIEIGCEHAQPHSASPSDGRPRPVWLIVEIMGRLSNLILRDDDGMILGALRLVDATENRYRTIAPHVSYRYPPPQTRVVDHEILPRLEPERVSAHDLEKAGQDMRSAGINPERSKRRTSTPLSVSDLLMAHLAGFGRELAAEVSTRALGAPIMPLTADVTWDRVADEIHLLAQVGITASWQPTLAYPISSADIGARDQNQEFWQLPSAFAVYRPAQYGDNVTLRPEESANTMLATYFADAEWRFAIDGAKQDLKRLLETHRDRSLRKQEALQKELLQQHEMKRLREEADILLAFQQEVPVHATHFTIVNPFAESELVSSTPTAEANVTISLDPALSVVENANRKYDRYHKLQRAGNHIPFQLETSALELARIEQLATDLALAETPDEIALVRAEIAEAGYLRQAKESPKAAKGKKTPKRGKAGKSTASGGRREAALTLLSRQSRDGFVMLVGKNSRQNEEATFHRASARDLWLHARGVPGAHVIIKSDGRTVPEATEREAAALAAYYSRSRSAGSVPVDITEQRYVRHLKGGGPGMVTYERERTIHIEPQDQWLHD
jgi:predicted ribosome quality control (RQC) complex YloA/Tae2 family protein